MTQQISPIPSGPNSIELSIPSVPERTAEVDRLIENLTSQAGYDVSICGDILIAVNEVVKNAILHGNRCDASKTVGIICSYTASEFRIQVRDSGTGFDPHAVPDPLDPANLMKESGRGILILRTLMDEVAYNISGDGTTVTLVKYCQKTA